MTPWSALFFVAIQPWPVLVAQIADGNDTSVWATLATQLGLSFVFFYQWRSSEAERKKDRDRYDSERREDAAEKTRLLVEMGGLLRETKDTMKDVQVALVTQVQRLESSPDRRDLDVAIKRLELLRDDMNRSRRAEDYIRQEDTPRERDR